MRDVDEYSAGRQQILKPDRVHRGTPDIRTSIYVLGFVPIPAINAKKSKLGGEGEAQNNSSVLTNENISIICFGVISIPDARHFRFIR